MAKFNLLTTLVLDAAGYSKGIDKAKKESQNLAKSVQTAGTSIKSSFGALGAMVTPLGGQFAGVGTAIQGVMGVIRTLPAVVGAATAGAVAASGGLLLAVITITGAVAGLIAWFKRSDEGADVLRNALNSINAIVDVFLDKLGMIGSAIAKLFKGDFKGATEDIKAAFTGWGDAMRENLATAEEQSALQDQLEKKMETYATDRQLIETKIADLQNKAREEEVNGIKVSAAERLAAANALAAAKKNLYDLDYSIKKLEYDIFAAEMANSADLDDNRTELNKKQAELNGLYTAYLQSKREDIKLSNKLLDNVREEARIAESKITDKMKPKGAGQIALPEAYQTIAPAIDGTTASMLNQQIVLSELINQYTKLGELTPALGGMFNALAGGLGAVNSKFGAYVGWIGKVITSTLGMIGVIKKLVVAQKAKAIGAAISGGAEMPFPYNLIAIATSVGEVIAAFASMPKFAMGGIVGGSSYSGDKVPAMVNSGEMILNGQQQANLFKQINSGGVGGGEVVFRIDGTQLVGVLSNHGKKINRIS